MLSVPDRISTLELSKLWLHKALQQFEVENTVPVESTHEQSNADEDQPQSDVVE